MITAAGLGLLYVAFFLWSVADDTRYYFPKFVVVFCILAGVGCLALAGILLSLRYLP